MRVEYRLSLNEAVAMFKNFFINKFSLSILIVLGCATFGAIFTIIAHLVDEDSTKLFGIALLFLVGLLANLIKLIVSYSKALSDFKNHTIKDSQDGHLSKTVIREDEQITLINENSGETISFNKSDVIAYNEFKKVIAIRLLSQSSYILLPNTKEIVQIVGFLDSNT